MKKRFTLIILLSLALLIAFTSCSLLLTKDKTDISAWYKTVTVGTKYNYSTITYKGGNTIETGSYTNTVMDILEEDGKIIVTMYGTGCGDFYVIYDKTNGMVAYTSDVYDKVINSATDNIILKTPVEVGNTWITADWYSETKEINVNQNVDAGTYSDCIYVESSTDQYDNDAYEYAYYSQSLGLMTVFRRTDWSDGDDDFSFHEELTSIE